MGQMDFISSILLDFYSKLSGMHFTDHTLRVYKDISPILS